MFYKDKFWVILDVRFLCYFRCMISVLFLIHDFCVIFDSRFLCYFWCTISVIFDVRFLCYFWCTISVIFDTRFLCYFWYTISLLFLIHDFCVIFDVRFLCYFLCIVTLLFWIFFFRRIYIFMSPPTLVGRHIVFVLSVIQFVSATPLKLLNSISWNLVGSKDTICSCAYYQEILIPYILWELCPFELKKFPKYTSEAACQCNSSETTEHNFMKLGR